MIFIGSENFAKYFDKTYIIKSNNLLPNPVSFHADMNICKIDDTVFLYKNCCFAKEIIKLGFKTVFIGETPKNAYPFDVFLNCRSVGKTVIMNSKTISKDILKHCEKTGKKIIDVKQGYAACSTLMLSETAFITSDKGVCNTLIKNGYSPLLIREGYIKIDEYNYGFIGGASGFANDILYFFGDITVHPDYKQIDAYLKQNNIEYKWFDCPLTDIGGMIEI